MDMDLYSIDTSITVSVHALPLNNVAVRLRFVLLPYIVSGLSNVSTYSTVVSFFSEAA